MIKLLEIFICGFVVTIELIVLLIIALLLQLIFYRVFRINIYRKIEKVLKK